jgi:hypothetical protein
MSRTRLIVLAVLFALAWFTCAAWYLFAAAPAPCQAVEAGWPGDAQKSVPFCVSGTGSAGAALTVTVPAVANKRNYLCGYALAVSASSVSSETYLTVSDGTTAKAAEVLAASAAAGTRLVNASGFPIVVTSTTGSTITLATSAPGGAAKLIINAWGFSE